MIRTSQRPRRPERTGKRGFGAERATYRGSTEGVPFSGKGERERGGKGSLGRGEEGKRRGGAEAGGRLNGARRPKPENRNPKTWARLLSLAVVLVGHPVFGQQAIGVDSVVARAQQDVRMLAAPEMAGRGYGTGGHLKAAAYIQDQFEAIGLEPLARGYRQAFPVAADVFSATPRLEVGSVTLRLGEAFLPYAASGPGEATRAPIITVESGLVVPGLGIDEYEGKRVEGAVVVLRSRVPDSVRANASPSAWSVEGRLEEAASRGARAAIVLVDRLVFGSGIYNARLPAFEVLETAWPDDAKTASFDVRVEQDRTVMAYNLIGLLPGTTYPDSTVLITAHYDGLGALGDSLYFPGANDNASGVAMLFSLARYFKVHPLRYTLAFVAFSGEEKGLIGSRYFVEHPVLDLSQSRFLLNFDMVASGEQGVVAVGGTDFPAAYARLEATNEALGTEPLKRRANAPNSDHFFLIQAGVPGFYLYTNAGTQPYHHAADVPATLDWDDFLYVYRLSKTFLEGM